MKIINSQTLGELCEFMLDGEPVFIIRAQDNLAYGVVEHYLDMTKKYKGKNSIRTEAQLTRIQQWQQENPSKVKIPD